MARLRESNRRPETGNRKPETGIFRRSPVSGLRSPVSGLPLLFLAASCSKLQGLSAAATPIATLTVEVPATAPDAGPPLAASPHVALVWGAQWLPEPFCVLPAESDAAAAVIRAGCPDSFGFVPTRVAASAPITLGGRATIDLYELPSADVMIGDVTARVVYGSLVVFDDRNGSGTLELRRGFRGDEVSPDGGVVDPADAGPLVPGGPDDLILGASFVSMTAPDRRLAFREGGFDEASAYYPRSGCPAPPRGFSVVAAGGFTFEAALAAALQGKLPPEDPATCATASVDDVVEVPLAAAPASVVQVACLPRGAGGLPRYREPPGQAPDLETRVWACAHLPSLGDSTPSEVHQLVVAGPPDNACPTLSHFLLRGCDRDPMCETPEWDRTASPPAWWPCPVP
jgi:hypothetical protein